MNLPKLTYMIHGCLIAAALAAVGCAGIPDIDRTAPGPPSVQAPAAPRVDPEVKKRADAARATGRSMDVTEDERKAADQALLAWLTDPAPDVREAAAWAVGERAGPPEAAPLLRALLNDTNDRVRMAAVTALGQLEPPAEAPDTLALLAARLGDPSSRVRADAARALAEAEDLPEDVTLALITRLDPAVEIDANVRAAAAEALADGADLAEVEEALTRALDDPDPGVVEKSRIALETRMETGAEVEVPN